MRYRIPRPKLGTLNLNKGADVAKLHNLLRAVLPEATGFSYSFADRTLEVEVNADGLLERVRAALASWGEVSADG